MMDILGLKKIDERLAAQFVTKYCSMYESGRYDTNGLTKAVVMALQKAYLNNKIYANTAFVTLKNKYPKENFPEDLKSITITS